MLQTAGLTAAEAYRAATVEPAAALRQDREFGAIKVGMRADLLLLDGNPLDDTTTLRNSLGVMANGAWLPRAKLQKALDRLAAIYAEPDAAVIYSRDRVAEAALQAKAVAETGYVMESEELLGLAASARGHGFSGDAETLTALAAVPQSGPCAATRY
jgi:adenine deaminase